MRGVRTVPRRESHWSASMLLMALILTFGVNCVPLSQMTSAPVADCPMATEHPCCVSDAERVEQGSIVKPFVLDPPSTALVATLSDEASFDHATVWRRSADSVSPLKEPDVPIYLLVSTFRV